MGNRRKRKQKKRIKNILHDPIVDSDLCREDLHIHTNLWVWENPKDDSSVVGSFDAYIDPMSVLLLIDKVNRSPSNRYKIKRIGFVDHNTILPSSVQDEILLTQEDGLDIHFGMEISSSVMYKRNTKDLSVKHVHLIVYDPPMDDPEVKRFMVRINLMHKRMLRYMFDQFCKTNDLWIIPVDWMYERAGIDSKSRPSKRRLSILKLFKVLTDDVLEEMADQRLNQLVRGTDVYGSIVRFASVIAHHPLNLRFFMYSKEFNTEDDVVKFLLNNFKELIDHSYISSEEVIQFAKKVDSPVVLAHPGKTRVNRTVINILIEQGLDGIEVFHPLNHDVEDLIKLASSRKVGITVGTDFHGSKHKDHLDSYLKLIKRIRKQISKAKPVNHHVMRKKLPYINNHGR